MKKQLLSKDVPARPATPGSDELPRVARVPVSGLLKKSSASVGTESSSSGDESFEYQKYDWPSQEDSEDTLEYSDDEAQGYLTD